ncbi:MAG: undecaprenyl/decaprenyl-phosphate alpha-N-acetylglucosaminyl 1-phosphate transferase [Flavobacteriaceae bacterium]|nr:undecaprenyl/decaprenyl-phosphate alpha-N-acetylglucosaminyl 1-phosphate transferase [Flavobacteriaceae bacterium]
MGALILSIKISIGFGALVLSSFLIFIINKKFLSKNLIDKVNRRSSHSSVATRTGGVSLFLTLFLISSYFYIIGYEIYEFSLLVPLSILTIVGLYDDINGVDFKLKFIFQIIVAKIIIDNGLIIDNLHGFAGIYELSRITAQLLTIFIIAAIINSINFIDGIDGLASTIVILFITGFEFFAISLTPYSNLSTIVIASLAPLYYFNLRNRNKVFLGDSGSLFLGGIISVYVITILTNDYIIKPEYDIHKILFVFSILLYPIIDIIRIFFLRIMKGKSPFIADKKHIHHILLTKLKSHIHVTLLISLFTLFFIVMVQTIF